MRSRGWWRVAQYAERAGAYEDALHAYETCAADEAFLNRATAATKVQQLTALLKDQAALEDLRNLVDAFAAKVKEAVGGKPVMINSGFRSKQVNDAVGSKDSSQHRQQMLLDLHLQLMM